MKLVDLMLSLTNLFKMTIEISETIKKLLENESIKKTIEEKSSEIQLFDSATYFFESLDRITSDDYIPSEQDVLRTRQPTTGVVETILHLDHLQVKLVDVAGQQNQRRKWIHCFDNVQALIFCADISSYDMKLRENPSVNRMKDSLDLFEETINSKWFYTIDVVLFLNKVDIFKDKLKKTRLDTCFPEYEGSNEYKEASNYIQEQFQARNTNSNRNIFTHLTCATSTDNMEVVFKAIHAIILNSSLVRSGLMGDRKSLND